MQRMTALAVVLSLLCSSDAPHIRQALSRRSLLKLLLAEIRVLISLPLLAVSRQLLATG